MSAPTRGVPLPSHSIFLLSSPFTNSPRSTATTAAPPMASSLSGVQISTTTGVVPRADIPRGIVSRSSSVSFPWKTGHATGRIAHFRPVASTPSEISDKVSDSIKKAEQACADDPAGGECVAAWDEVEELSAAASHARDKQKDSDPLENYCKDNPETDECRTYDS